MRVNPFFVPGIVIAIFVGSIVIASLTGGWIVTGRTTVDPTTMTAADLKGWMTLQQVMDGLNISQAELYKIIGIGDDVPVTTALKDLEKLVSGFETSTLRDALQSRSATSAATP